MPFLVALEVVAPVWEFALRRSKSREPAIRVTCTHARKVRAADTGPISNLGVVTSTLTFSRYP